MKHAYVFYLDYYFQGNKKNLIEDETSFYISIYGLPKNIFYGNEQNNLYNQYFCFKNESFISNSVTKFCSE